MLGQTGLSKQCRSRSDAAKRGVRSGSTLFATYPAILQTFTGVKMGLLKRGIMKSVPNLSKISNGNKMLSQRGASESAPVLYAQRL